MRRLLRPPAWRARNDKFCRGLSLRGISRTADDEAIYDLKYQKLKCLLFN